MAHTITIDILEIADGLKQRGTDHTDSNAILDILENLYDLETLLAREFKG